VNTLHKGDGGGGGGGGGDDDDEGIKMASHTMQFTGKRRILQILQETKNSIQKDKNISNKHITGKLKQIR
jgi:hypothetical protein